MTDRIAPKGFDNATIRFEFQTLGEARSGMGKIPFKKIEKALPKRLKLNNPSVS
ncbi:MAG: hypothetical protein Q8L81_00500 [Bacteroidota bacterium]|nr:hypothetical protein [Bacteroidota bacterium]